MFEQILKEVQLGDRSISLGKGKVIAIVHPCELLDLKVLPKDVYSVNSGLIEQKLDLSAPDDSVRAATLLLSRRGLIVVSWATKLQYTCAVIPSRKDLTARFRLTAGKKSKLQEVIALKNDLVKWVTDYSIPTFTTLLDAIAFCQKRPLIEYDPTGLTQQIPVNDVVMDIIGGRTVASINGVNLLPGKDKNIKYLSYDAGLLDYWDSTGPNNFKMLLIADRPVPDMYKSFFLHRNVYFYPIFMQTNVLNVKPFVGGGRCIWSKLVIMSVEGNESRSNAVLMQLEREGVSDAVVINGKAGVSYLPFGNEITHAKDDEERWGWINKMNEVLKAEGKLDKAVSDMWRCKNGLYNLVTPGYYAHYLEFSNLLIEQGKKPGFTVYLEDDSHLCKRFVPRVVDILSNAPKDWDVIVLGYDCYLYSKFGGEVERLNDIFIKFKGTQLTKAEGLTTSFPNGSLIGMYGLIINNSSMIKVYSEMWPMKFAADVLLGQLATKGKINMFGLVDNLVLEDKGYSDVNFGKPLSYAITDHWMNVSIYPSTRFKGVVCLVGAFNSTPVSVLSDRVACFSTYTSAMLWRVAAEHVTSLNLRDSIYVPD